jgi:hypothetical protein
MPLGNRREEEMALAAARTIFYVAAVLMAIYGLRLRNRAQRCKFAIRVDAWDGRSGISPRYSSQRRDDFIEQREHSHVAPHVVDANQCADAVAWTQGFERKIVRNI